MTGPCASPTITFGTASTIPAAGAEWFEVGDLDGDGFPDIVVTTGSDILILFNDTTGHFSSSRQIRPGETAPGDKVAIADFDGDGHLDVLASPVQGTTMTLYRRDPASSRGFLAGVTTIVSIQPDFPTVVAGNFDGDARADAAVVAYNPNENNDVASQVFLGTATGAFTAGTTLPNTLDAVVAAVDLDQDGHLDLLGLDVSDHLWVGYGDGAGSFTYVTSGKLPSNAVIILSGRFSTGAPDVIVPSRSNEIDMFAHSAPRTMAPFTPIYTGFTTIPNSSWTGQVVDLDGNGRDDVVAQGHAITQCGPPLPLGTFAQPPGIPLALALPPNVEITSNNARFFDLNGDGKPDLVAIDTSHENVITALQQ